MNNLPKIAMQLCPGVNRMHVLVITSPTLYRYATAPPEVVNFIIPPYITYSTGTKNNVNSPRNMRIIVESKVTHFVMAHKVFVIYNAV